MHFTVRSMMEHPIVQKDLEYQNDFMKKNKLKREGYNPTGQSEVFRNDPKHLMTKLNEANWAHHIES